MYSDRLVLAETLIAVIESGSFSAAAEQLGISQSTVSRRIAKLQRTLGGQPLFRRGSRWIEPTPKTEAYVRDIRQVISHLDAAAARVRQSPDHPSGLLKISLPPALGRARFLQPLAALVRTYRDLRLQIDLSEQYVDMSEGAFDLVVRIKPMQQTGIDQLLIGECAVRFCASPDYLEGAPVPRVLGDLAAHDFIGLPSLNDQGKLSVAGRDFHFSKDTRPRLTVNDFTAIHDLVLAGHGIGILPDYLIETALASGDLVSCLSDVELRPVQIYLLHPRGLQDAPAIKVAIETLTAAAQ